MADYRKMWEELGMDLETHDQLCAVLPTAFGDVYLSQENRPEGMGFWDVQELYPGVSILKFTLKNNDNESDAISFNIKFNYTGNNAIDGIEADNAVAEYYNLQGVKVANPEKGGMYIVRRGAKVSKEIVR